MRKKDISLIIAVITLLVGSAITLVSDMDAPPQSYVVAAVIDGDTITVRKPGLFSEEETVRLLGVNTPETVDPRRPVECYGYEASAYVKEQLPIGSYVYLESDEYKSDRDKYGRLLRYVRKADGTGDLINQNILAAGYGYEESYGERYTLREEFKRAETEAQTEKRGLWQDGGCKN